MTVLRRDPSKALLIGFLALLLVSSIQAGYWITDHVRYVRNVENRIAALYRADAEVVGAFLSGRTPDALEQTLPHLDIDGRRATVAPAALGRLAEETARRSNRYVWEGAFFLAVLIGGMAVLTRTIRHDLALRRRQQNFLAAVSHEFKSPLASVRLAAETLVMRSQEPDTQRLGKRVLEDGDRLLRMVDNLLETTRLEEGRHQLAAQTVDVQGAADAALREIAERAALHGIRIEANIDEGLTLDVDPSALETVLRNVLDNAVKACVAGEGERIEMRAHRVARHTLIEIRDDGIGFPPEDAAIIFDKFYRLGDELKRTTPGTGLGLYIVKRLVELSGGTIGAASDGPGRGAIVTVSWPVGGAA